MKNQGLRLAILRDNITNIRSKLKEIIDNVVTPIQEEEARKYKLVFF